MIVIAPDWRPQRKPPFFFSHRSLSSAFLAWRAICTSGARLVSGSAHCMYGCCKNLKSA